MAKNINKFNIFRPILAILLVFIPLYPKFPLFSVKNTYVSIRLDDIIIVSSLIVLLLSQIKDHFSLIKTNIFKLFLPYFAVIFVSFLNAVLILKTDPVNILLLHSLRKFEYISVFFLTLQAIKQRKDLSYPLIFLTLASIFVAIYGFGQKYLSFPIVSTMNEEFSKGYLLTLTVWSRISSTFAGHYDLAAFLSVFLVILAGVLILTKNKLAKFSLIIIWLILYYLLTLTASRVSIFALWGGLIICFLSTKKFLWIIPSSLIILYSMTTSSELNQRLIATIKTTNPKFDQTITTKKPLPTIMLTPTVLPVTPTPNQNLPKPSPKPTIFRNKKTPSYPQVDIDAGVSRSGEIRFNVEWPRAIIAFKKNILIGTGLGSLGLATDNDFLRLLGESGILGLLTFMAIPIYFFIKTLKNKQKLNFVFLSALATFLANAVFIDVFEASKTAYLFWIMMAVYYQNLTLKPSEK